eukprot:g42540.t1
MAFSIKNSSMPSDDLAERGVQTLNVGLKKQHIASLDTKLSQFLFDYRTPSCNYRDSSSRANGEKTPYEVKSDLPGPAGEGEMASGILILDMTILSKRNSLLQVTKFHVESMGMAPHGVKETSEDKIDMVGAAALMPLPPEEEDEFGLRCSRHKRQATARVQGRPKLYLPAPHFTAYISKLIPGQN